MSYWMRSTVEERVAVNASPLILLGKVERLSLLEAVGQGLHVPGAVRRELLAKSDGEPIVDAFTKLRGAAFLEEVAIADSVRVWDLGAGETQVIAAALEHGMSTVVVDDRQARRCAHAMGLKVVGTLGVVARARQMGAIASAASVIEELRQAGLYIADDLVQLALRELGERG
ncbi:MAG: DUF3368 domain-containing protein [Pseudomonadota bacterium]